MKGERRPLKAKLLEYRKTKKQQESRKEENLQQSNPTSTHQNQASHSARENETPQNLWKRPEPRQEADHLTSFPAARETNIPTDTEHDEPLSHQKNVLPLDAPAWRCILENFGFDLLDNYPMRKWRDYCEKSPLRCWFFTGCFWAIGQFIAAKAEFGFVFLITCMLLLIFLNLGIRKEGELSAYSVFNPNYERLLGELTGEDFERELLMRKGIGKSSISE